MSKKILLLFWGRSGGGARYTLEIAKELKSICGDSLLLSLSGQNDLIDEFSILDSKIYYVNTYKSLWQIPFFLLRLPFYIFKLFKICKLNKVDVVYAPMTHLFNSFILKFLKKLGVKYVLTMHDAKTHQGDRVTLLNYLLKNDISHADHFIALSNSVGNEIEDLYGINKSQISVIPHGSFGYGKQSPKSLSFDKPVNILFFGRILEYKGLGLLLDSLVILSKLNNSLQFKLTIAGNGSIKAYQDKIKDLRLMGVDVVCNVRWIEESEISCIFNQADLCAVPYIEASQSGVIAISLASGVPVVATPVAGLVEQLEFGGGLLSRNVSAFDFAESLNLILCDPVFYRECSEAGISISNTHYNWSSITERLYNTFNIVD